MLQKKWVKYILTNNYVWDTLRTEKVKVGGGAYNFLF